MSNHIQKNRRHQMNSRASQCVDPIDAAGLTFTDFSVEELDRIWRDPGGGEQKMRAHLAALDRVGAINEEVLLSIVQGSPED